MGYSIIHPINMENSELHNNLGLLVCRSYYHRTGKNIKTFGIDYMSILIEHQDPSEEHIIFKWQELGISFDSSGDKYWLTKKSPLLNVLPPQ